MQRPPQVAIVSHASDAQSDGRKLLEDFHRYKGIILRGWRFIVICVLAALTAAIIYIATQKPTYKAASRLLVIQQSGRPVHVGGANDPFYGDGRSDDNLATHLLLLKSPMLIEQALNASGVRTASIGSVISDLTVKQPDPSAKIVDLVYKSRSAEEARRILDGVIESYKQFLKSNFQKSSNDVIGLITRARNDLNEELKALEKAYLEYRQKNPAYSADSTGHTFVARRLDQWDQALNQFAARAVQLQSQLELGKKMSREGVDPASLANILGQVGTIGVAPTAGPAPQVGSATSPAANDGSYISLARELAEVESRRKTAELYLESYRREHQDAGAAEKVPDREIERRFLEDPDVAPLKAKLDSVYVSLEEASRVARSATDPSIAAMRRRFDALKDQYERLWARKRPILEETLLMASNPEVAAGYRTAEAELFTLRARESALRARLDQVAGEELQKLGYQLEQARREHGELHPLVAGLRERIAGIEGRRQQPAEGTGAGNASALLDYMTQSLQSIEAMRSDLQKKFDEDLSLSKKAEIANLEESNLRSNLERQRTLFNSVVDQLKQARLVSDYDSVSTQIIAPTTVAADQKLVAPLLLLAVVVGVGLGSGVAFLADLIEARVRTIGEIRKLVDLPLIGIIPHIREDQLTEMGTAGLLSHRKPRSAIAESYKTTRTNLEFLRRSRRARVLLVASSLPSDGKTTTACNLAITLASAGRRVLLIDGDLRKPSLHRIFEVPREGGLSDALLGNEPMDRLIQRTFVGDLDLLTTGRDVSNPAELLASERLGEIFQELAAVYDMVLIDSSPLLLVTDPSIIAAVADGIILVVKISSTRRHDLEVTGDMLKSLGTPAFGMVINGVKREEVGYGYGGYGYGGYGYGGYGYGRKANPYVTPDDAPANGHGSLAYERLPSIGTNGKAGHDHGRSEPANG